MGAPIGYRISQSNKSSNHDFPSSEMTNRVVFERSASPT
jgi:hypothetical protein